MKITKASVATEDPAPLLCSECGAKIYTCDNCKEYFNPDDMTIYCVKRGTMQSTEHYCESCGEEYEEIKRRIGYVKG